MLNALRLSTIKTVWADFAARKEGWPAACFLAAMVLITANQPFGECAQGQHALDDLGRRQGEGIGRRKGCRSRPRGRDRRNTGKRP